MARGKFTTLLRHWDPLKGVQNLSDFDQEYCELIAKYAKCEPDDFRTMFFYLAKTCDSRRYVKAQPDNLGKRRRPRVPVPPAAEAVYAKLLADGETPTRAAHIAAQGDEKLTNVLRNRRNARPEA